MHPYRWVHDADHLDWDELSALYRVAPLGDKPPAALRTVFGNSRFVSLVVRTAMRSSAPAAPWPTGSTAPTSPTSPCTRTTRAAGSDERSSADLVELSSAHQKIILYANPGKEGFYAKLGFLPMNTAMAVWHDPAGAIESGILRPA